MKKSIFIFFNILIISCSSNKEETAFNCENLIQSDSITFYENKIEFEPFDSICDLKKANNKIVIPNSKITFKDSLNSEVFSYRVLGKNKKRNWYSIIAQDPLQNHYYLYNKNNNKLDTLIGEPKIFNTKILSIEDQYTDYPEMIQIWEIHKNGTIKKAKEFSIKYCKEWRITDSYLKNGKMYIKCGGEYSDKAQFYQIELNKKNNL